MTAPAPRATSLLRRVSLQLGLVVLVALVIQFFSIVSDYTRNEGELATNTLYMQSDILFESLVADNDGGLTLVLPQEIVDRYQRYPKNYAYRVRMFDGKIIAEANASLIPPIPSSTSHAPVEHTIPVDSRWNGRALAQWTEKFDETVLVEIAMDGDPAGLYRQVLLREIQYHVLVPLLPLGILMLIVNILAVRHSLRPVMRVARQAQRLEPGRSGLRLDVAGLPSEIEPLVTAVNTAMARADHVVLTQQEFTANVAHELRTPLSILTLELAEINHPKAEQARRDIQEIVRHVNQLVRISQWESVVAEPVQPVGLSLLAHDAVRQFAPLAVEAGREIAFEDKGASIVPGHAGAIASALRNLIENALRVTPTATTVTVVAGPGAQIEVRDAGPGIAPETRHALFDRHVQGSPSTRGGGGLGLAIVRKTMEIHNGDVTVENLAEGGCCFRLSFAL